MITVEELRDEAKFLKSTGRKHSARKMIKAADVIEEYETWFKQNLTMLATHRIGGFRFGDDE